MFGNLNFKQNGGSDLNLETEIQKLQNEQGKKTKKDDLVRALAQSNWNRQTLDRLAAVPHDRVKLFLNVFLDFEEPPVGEKPASSELEFEETKVPEEKGEIGSRILIKQSSEIIAECTDYISQPGRPLVAKLIL